MDTNKPSYKTIEEYIQLFPEEVKKILQIVRKTIQEEVPTATEAISYQMPTFKLHGKNLVHFAAWKQHIGFYPTPSGLDAFKKDLERYNGAKGSVQFPLNEPMPLSLIRKIVRYRVGEVEKLFSKQGK